MSEVIDVLIDSSEDGARPTRSAWSQSGPRSAYALFVKAQYRHLRAACPTHSHRQLLHMAAALWATSVPLPVKSKYVQASADERRRSSAPHSPVSRVTTTVFPGLVNAPAKLELSALGASNLALHNITLHSEPPVSEDTAARAVLPALPPSLFEGVDWHVTPAMVAHLVDGAYTAYPEGEFFEEAALVGAETQSRPTTPLAPTRVKAKATPPSTKTKHPLAPAQPDKSRATKAKKAKVSRDKADDDEPEGAEAEAEELEALAARWKELDFATKKKEHRRRMRWIARRLKEAGSKPTVTRLTNYLQQRVALKLTIAQMVEDLHQLHARNGDWNLSITEFNVLHGGKVKSRLTGAVSGGKAKGAKRGRGGRAAGIDGDDGDGDDEDDDQDDDGGDEWNDVEGPLADEDDTAELHSRWQALSPPERERLHAGRMLAVAKWLAGRHAHPGPMPPLNKLVPPEVALRLSVAQMAEAILASRTVSADWTEAVAAFAASHRGLAADTAPPLMHASVKRVKAETY